jgi:general secretion pathway protein B
MSLILEALRKSEAERRLGRVPDLMSPMPASNARERSGTRLVLAIFVLLLALAGVAWWMMRNAAEPVSIAVDPPGAIETSSGKPGNASTTVDPPAFPPEPSPEAPIVKVPAEVVDSPAIPAKMPGAAVTRMEPTLPQDPEFVSIERESVPLPVQAAPDPAIVPAPAMVVANPDPQSEITTQNVDAAATATPTTTPEVEVALPTLGQLLPSERDSLPTLKLSMHVFTESVENRFVLIDGRRMGEGESIAPSLRLVEIRRDGAVLDFNGRRFLLRRP